MIHLIKDREKNTLLSFFATESDSVLIKAFSSDGKENDETLKETAFYSVDRQELIELLKILSR